MILDPASEWAGLVVDALVASGVTELVVSPGSRSTPLVLAAEREGLAMRDVVDERSAAFVALGRSRAGFLTACLCTSGTAPAHWFPAVIEASLARVPLVLLSADRPLELADCDAPQTVNQVGLFGGHVRAFVELGVPDAAGRGLRRRVSQAVSLATGPEPGPVHLNARFQKPLEPHAATTDERPVSLALRSLREEPLSRRWTTAALPSAEALARLRVALRGRGIVVAGPAALAQGAARTTFLELAARIGWPLVAESTSQLRFGPAHPSLVDAGEHIYKARRLAPEVIVQLGAPPTSLGWDAPRWVLSAHGWPDPGQRAQIIAADPAEVARALLDGNLPSCDPSWAQIWAAANSEAWNAVEHVLPRHGLSEALTARMALRALPAGGLFFVGNSLSIRHLDAYVRSDVAVGVLSQRGANGIDGLISGAAGAASTGRPVTLLIGDVSLLHDVGGLATARHTNLDILVVDNGGGRIFDQLPLGKSGADMSHFLTPPRLDLPSLARAFGIDFASARTPSELGVVLARAARPRLIEVVVPPRGARDVDRDVMEALA